MTSLIDQEKFFAKIKELGIPQEHIAIAVSGGADSMCLALLFSSLPSVYHITCLIVDHKLRKTSTQEALDTANFLKQRNINCEILTCTQFDCKQELSNMQHKARQARYKLLLSYCKENSINYLCIGHHADDQAETVLMRIERGSGIDGISAMAEFSKRDGIIILRPLLNFTKKQIISTLRAYRWGCI